MDHIKFNPEKLQKLNNPKRLLDQPPALIWEKLQLQRPKTLIDIGAGTGFFSIPFVEMSDDGVVYACDISDVMLEWLTENIVPTHPNVIPLKMEESVVPLHDEIGDLVFMINLHHELKEPLEILKECQRVLKKNGKIAIIDWKKEDTEQGPPQKIRYDTATVAEQLKTVGFKNVEIHTDLVKHFVLIAQK